MTPLPSQGQLGRGHRPLTRRRFIAAAAGGIAIATLVSRGVPVELAHADSALLASRLADLNQESFARYIGEVFQFTIPLAAPISLQLVEVEDRSQGSGHGGECFAILFRGTQDRTLTQGTYEVWNRRSGTFVLFVVPMRADGGAPTYEALFNRLPA